MTDCCNDKACEIEALQTRVFEAIGVIGLAALAANLPCLALLWRHRSEDINMRSVWLCSRNDIIAYVSVLFAALGVRLSGSGWYQCVSRHENRGIV